MDDLGTAIPIQDLAGSITRVPLLEAGKFVGAAVFDGADKRLFAKWCSDGGDCDLVSIELETGLQTLVGVPSIFEESRTGPTIGWAPYAVDIDANADGLADGML